MMQQTETYKLNKPESTDTFSVGPLNENADKIETALAALEGTAAAEAAARQALDQRVTALEVHKIAVGIYQGGGGEKDIKLGFTPIAVIIFKQQLNPGASAMVVTGSYAGTEAHPIVTLTEDGFHVGVYLSTPINDGTGQYHYIAFG